MSALTEALTAAQAKALTTLEKAYVAGNITADALAELLDALYEQIPDDVRRDAVNVEVWKLHDLLRAALRAVEDTPE